MAFREDLDRTVDERWEEETESDEEARELLYELDRFLVELFDPADVGDIRAMPKPLQKEAVLFLIDRDASDYYDQIDGFVDTVLEEDLPAQILEGCASTDSGLEICEWISKNIPETPSEVLQ